MLRMLVVEDKESFQALLVRLLDSAHPGSEIVTAGGARPALDLLEKDSFDLVLTDVRLPDGDGFEVLSKAKALHPHTEVVMMTAFATIDAAVAAVRAGAYDYLAKPFEPDDLALTVARALERRSLRARAQAAEATLQRMAATAEMLGDSAAMAQVRRLIERVAALDVAVLISGESGTGKELVARALHRASPRHGGPFVAINCGAIPGTLIESELFGHARGAFSGATNAKPGLFEEASGGTIFLDEIGELPLDLQVKLNRVLQERTCRRLGESQERPIDARVVAATLRPLDQLAAEGRFREDLYFRLNVYPIALPPLRERGEDIVLLAHHFRDQAATRFRRPPLPFSTEALRALLQHAWPGNVRELRNVVERALILSEGDAIVSAGLPAPNSEARLSRGFDGLDGTYREAMERAREQASRIYLEALLVETEGNVTRAAERAGVERESLHRLLRRAGLDATAFRPG